MKCAPSFVQQVTTLYGAWIVGGAALPSDEPPRDWDIIVPWESWRDVALLIPGDARPNTFGGWRFKTHTGHDIDIWPEDLGVYIARRGFFKAAYHPKSGLRLVAAE